MIQISDDCLWYYLNHLYATLNVDTRLFHNTKNINETYGEILFPSVNKLMRSLSLTELDVLFDLGSGIGKAAIQIFLTTNLRMVHGIEIRPALHTIATRALHTIRNEMPTWFKSSRMLSFTQADFLQFPLTTATILLLGSPCFDLFYLNEIAKIIDHSATIRYVLSLKPLPKISRLQFNKAIRIECSWDSTLCYLYC